MNYINDLNEDEKEIVDKIFEDFEELNETIYEFKEKLIRSRIDECKKPRSMDLNYEKLMNEILSELV